MRPGLASIPRWRRLGAVLVAGATSTVGCGADGGPTAEERCRELELVLTPRAAWDDMAELQERAEEWVELDCRRRLHLDPSSDLPSS